MAVRKPSIPTLTLGFCHVDQEKRCTYNPKNRNLRAQKRSHRVNCDDFQMVFRYLFAAGDEIQYFLFFRHNAKCTFACRNQGSTCVGECDHFQKLLICQIFQTMLQHIIQNTCTEGISGTSCLNGVFLQERSCFHDTAVIVSAASLDRKSVV